MNNLFIIESPFQLISAVEANFHFKGNNLFIIKYTKNTLNDNQIKFLISFFNLKNVIEITPFTSNFEADIRLLLLLKQFIKQKRSFDNIFIGEYRSFHMRKFFDVFKNANKYCLDDGNISLEIAKFIKNKKDQYYYKGFKGKIKKFIYSLGENIFKLNKPVQREIKLFTCFDITYDIDYIKHGFEKIKNKYIKNIPNKNIVYFYGSNLSELEIPTNIELKYLKFIKQYFENKHLKIIYIPHRKETEQKIDLIKRIGFEIKNNSYPAEIQPIFDNILPKHIASFTSSVLQTLPILYDFESVTSFKIDKNFIIKKYQEEIETIYKHYSNKMNIIQITI